MSDDLLSMLGRKQRKDLEDGGEPSSEDDALARPFDADTRAAILDEVFARVDEAAAAPEPAEPSRVVQLPPRSRRALIGIPLAVAAALALLWGSRPKPSPEPNELVAMVPTYTFTKLEGGIATRRSEPEPTPAAAVPELELRASSTIDWVLTPAQPTQGPIGVALLARSDAGATQLVPRVAAEISPQGAVRLRGRLDALLDLAPGGWTLTLLIAAPDRLPTRVDAVDDEPAPWRSLAIRVIIVADE